MNELLAAQLRAEFDRSFTVAAAPAAATRDFVLIRVADASYALAADELCSIEPRVELVPLPSSQPSLLGIAGLRGEVVPVFSLARLLGTGTLTRRDDGRWRFALVNVPGVAAQTLGLAFDELLRFVRIERASLFDGGGGTRTLRHAEVLYSVLDLRAILERIVHSRTPSRTANDEDQKPGMHGDRQP